MLSKVSINSGNMDVQLQADHLSIMTYCFNSHPQAPHKPLSETDRDNTKSIKKVYENTVHYVVYEDEEPISGADFDNYEINIRGSIFKNGAVQDVCTLPEGRRKGYTNLIFQKMFNDFHSDGFVVSTLYPV
jgi:predicted acetyltransferase